MEFSEIPVDVVVRIKRTIHDAKIVLARLAYFFEKEDEAVMISRLIFIIWFTGPLTNGQKRPFHKTTLFFWALADVPKSIFSKKKNIAF